MTDLAQAYMDLESDISDVCSMVELAMDAVERSVVSRSLHNEGLAMFTVTKVQEMAEALQKKYHDQFGTTGGNTIRST